MRNSSVRIALVIGCWALPWVLERKAYLVRILCI